MKDIKLLLKEKIGLTMKDINIVYGIIYMKKQRWGEKQEHNDGVKVGNVLEL